MLKISFTNAEVSDHGYGLEVNGKSLEDIISTALGTKLKGNGGYGSGLPSFNSNSCDVTVIINPHKCTNTAELQEELGVSRRTLRTDIAYLKRVYLDKLITHRGRYTGGLEWVE